MLAIYLGLGQESLGVPVGGQSLFKIPHLTFGQVGTMALYEGGLGNHLMTVESSREGSKSHY